MKVRVWVAFAIAYVLGISMVVLVSHILNRLLQMPLINEYITTGISIFAATLGIVLAILYYYAKQKR